jgi:UrcA family protein
MKKFVRIAVAVTAAFAAMPAAAQDLQFYGNGAYRISIPYGDLNLASPAGLKTLEGRVKAAAWRVCGLARPMTLIERRERKDCREGVFRAARPQVTLAAAGTTDGKRNVIATL